MSTPRPRIVADANIPRVGALFAPLGEVRLLPGRQIDAAAVAAADVLLVRSVTRVDRALLARSRVRFVGSATIGTDHLDLPWLQQAGIAWANAPGSNADSVVEYVLAALCTVPGMLERLLAGEERVAVVGLGNVGGRLCRRLRGLGIAVAACDPLLEATPDNMPLLPLREALSSAVVCLHTPLTDDGPHPTRHLLDADALGVLPPGALLLNAGRGAVVASQALAARLRGGELRAVLDVWEEEPALPPELLGRCQLATPHIAGHSVDGKLAGALMVLAACQRHLGIPVAAPGLALPAAPALSLRAGDSDAGLLRQAVLGAYDIAADARALRAALAAGEGAAGFDRLRREYPPRRGFEHHALRLQGTLSARQCGLLRAAGFTGPLSGV